jgi:hypothetical protein
MNNRQHQLLERDVRTESPDINPTFFLSSYLKSNFPQTSAHPSSEQLKYGIFPQPEAKGIEYSKKPLSGTSYDNPAGS